MSGATDARDKVREALDAPYRHVQAAGADYVTVRRKALAAADLVDTMAHAAEVILALDHLQAMAADAAKQARAVLGAQMMETGCHTVTTSTFTAFLQKKPAYVTLGDSTLVPADYWRTPDPVIDMRSLKTALTDGVDVPGAGLTVPNDFTLAIRIKK